MGLALGETADLSPNLGRKGGIKAGEQKRQKLWKAASRSSSKKETRANDAGNEPKPPVGKDTGGTSTKNQNVGLEKENLAETAWVAGGQYDPGGRPLCGTIKGSNWFA